MSKWYPCVYCTEDLHCTKYAEPGYESWCVLGPCKSETPSNADRIRAMTDEELAKMWMEQGCPKSTWEKPCPYPNEDGTPCHNCWLDWLKSPVEVDE